MTGRVGRLLHDTGALLDGKYDQLEEIARRRGQRFEFANLLDSLQAERDQNVTIDTTQIRFTAHSRWRDQTVHRGVRSVRATRASRSGTADRRAIHRRMRQRAPRLPAAASRAAVQLMPSWISSGYAAENN